jgi:hypothetical protein
VDDQRLAIELKQRLGSAHARALAAGKNNHGRAFAGHSRSRLAESLYVRFFSSALPTPSKN